METVSSRTCPVLIKASHKCYNSNNMGQFIRTNKPDKPVPGAALLRGSVSGRKTKFVNDTTLASISFTMSAGTRTSLGFHLDLWAPDLPLEAQLEDNIVTWDDCVAWTFEDVYIDVEAGANYIGSPSLTSDQSKVSMEKMNQLTPSTLTGSTPHTVSTRYIFINDGASSHTVIFYGRYKYIIYGDGEL